MAMGKTRSSSPKGGHHGPCIGLAPVNILAVNPTKEELKAIYGRETDRNPDYLGEAEVDGKKVKYARIDFLVRTVKEESNGIEMTSRITFFVRNAPWKSRKGDKVQVIDAYGRTAWVTQEQLDRHEIPLGSKGPARLSENYRVAYRGEDKLTEFLKAYLCIPSPEVWDTATKGFKVVTDKEYLKGCHCRLDSVSNLFKGDVSEIKDSLALRPNNSVKVLFGVKESGSGYQDVFTNYFMETGRTSTKAIEKELKRCKDAGAYRNTVFEVCPLKPYVPRTTSLETPPEHVEMPFGEGVPPAPGFADAPQCALRDTDEAIDDMPF